MTHPRGAPAVPVALRADLVPGYRLGRYELLFPVAHGGMASVWVARLVAQHGFEKIVAIKTILPAYAGDANFQRMFLDEARTSARIEHVNVVRVIDLGDQDGILFLVMEWLEGETLVAIGRAAAEEGRALPLGVLLRVAIDACAGLHAAHELRDREGQPLGIVHRDVSPHNVLISKQGVAKVIDFGIAKTRDRTARETEVGAFKGKVRYMAPEQAVDPRAIDRRTDVWGVGAVLYRYLTGRTPYEAETDVATVALLGRREPPPAMPDDVPPAIREVVSRCLSWDAAGRYPTAEALRLALEAAVAEARVAATHADVAACFASQVGPQVEERKRAVAAALVAAEVRARQGGEALAAGSDGSSSGVAAAVSVRAPATPRRRWSVLVAAAGLAVGVAAGCAIVLGRAGAVAPVAASATASAAPSSAEAPPASVAGAAVTAAAVATPGAGSAAEPSPAPSTSPAASGAAASARTPGASDRPPRWRASGPAAAPRPTPGAAPVATTPAHRGYYGF